MGLENRPFIGSWRLGRQKLVSMTPDALVYLNGELSIPGCQTCKGNLDIQKYVTEVSVEAGVTPGSMSANFTLSIPMHGNEAFVRDAQFLITPGFEVHIYFRGYFAVKGMYSNLAEPETIGTLGTSGETLGVTASKFVPGGSPNWNEQANVTGNLNQVQLADWARRIGVTSDFLNLMLTVYAETNIPKEQIVVANAVLNRLAVEKIKGNYYGTNIWQITTGKRETTGAQTDAKSAFGTRVIPNDKTLKDIGERILRVLQDRINGGTGNDIVNFVHFANDPGLANRKLKEWMAEGLCNISPEMIAYVGVGNEYAYYLALPSGNTPNRDKSKNQALGVLGITPEQVVKNVVPATPQPEPGTKITMGPSLLEKSGLNNKDIENVLAYPYYQCFHGIVIQVGCTQSTGVQTISVQCQSLLHFWQFQKAATQGAAFATMPKNSGNKVQLLGHSLTGYSPYGIVYYLYHNTVGDAAGVSFAIDQKTNIDAKDGTANIQMYSLIQKYWEKRFNSREAKLRMHGASGNLFNSIQAEVLGRTQSVNLTTLLRKKFKPAGQGADSNIKEFTLFKEGDFRIGGAAATAMAAKKPGAFIANVTDMQAYVNDPGKWGSVSLFESTYETKMDIIQNVMKVTGFEFYQDVDGDFVFKPPMYNLDTRSSRVYRIEDIDIITLTFEEREPSVTYMLGKGSQFANMHIDGLDGEFGVKGDFFDYKLIGQFGWREGSFETGAVSDPMAVRYMAINEMAILNAGMNSASVSIPLRPEIRPGYPVYIVSLDCFYYVTSVSHSFSMGGQCTTNLTLVAKRAKFFAPGDPDKQGIDAIDLSNMELPKKPLTVLDGGGKIRMVGFPNVVMALDPDKLSPLEALEGISLDKLDDPSVLEKLINAAVLMKILRKNADGTYSFSTSGNQEIRFSFTNVETAKGENKIVNLSDAAKAYGIRRSNISEQQKASDERIGELQNLINRLQKSIAGIKPTTEAGKKSIAEANTEISDLQTKINNEYQLMENTSNNYTDNGLSQATQTNLNSFLKVLGTMLERYGSVTGDGWDYVSKASTTNLLDLLTSKKAAFNGDNLKGEYRYYSASHPEAEQQGQKKVSIDVNGIKTLKTASLENPKKVNMFLNGDRVVKRTDGLLPEATLGVGTPKNGINVATSLSEKPIAVVATSDIREVCLAIHETDYVAPVTNTQQVSRVQNVDQALSDSMKTNAIAYAKKKSGSATDPSMTLGGFMKEWFDKAEVALEAAADKAKSAIAPFAIPTTNAMPLIVNLLTFGATVNTSFPISKYKYNGNLDNKNASDAFTNSEMQPLMNVWDTLAGFYGAAIASSLLQVKKAWIQALPTTLKPEQKLLVISTFSESLAASYGVTIQPVTTAKTANVKNEPLVGYSPVIPISDANGYEVYGMYRYGRDISIEPDGVFDVLANQDPLVLLDKSTVTQIIDTYIEGKPFTVKTTKEVGGKTVTVEKAISGPQTANAAERTMISQFKGKVSNTQLLDLSLAQSSGDPNLVQMNFANWVATKGKDGIQKIPVNNAAYSLATLKPENHYGKVCSCRMSEASVMLDTATQVDFIKYASPGTSIPQALVSKDTDTPTKQVIANAVRLSSDWQASQAALRGQVLDTQGSNLISVIQSTGSSLDQQAEQLGSNAEQLVNEIENAWNIATNIGKKK